jgi:Multiubiquitin
MEVSMSELHDVDGRGRPDHPKTFEIKIDRMGYKVQASSLTGAELRRLPEPDIGLDRDLFEVVPGGSDLKIELDAKVDMRNGLRFFTAPAQINPGHY